MPAGAALGRRRAAAFSTFKGQTREDPAVTRRMAALLLCGMVLSGCYESQDLLLDSAAARQPIRAGDHTLTDEDGKVTMLRLSPRPDGWYDVQQIDAKGDADAHKVLFNELDRNPQRALFAYATYDGKESAYVYGVLAVTPDGQVRRKSSDCHRKADIKIAASNAAEVHTDTCQFYRNDKALLAALKALAQNPKHWDEVD